MFKKGFTIVELMVVFVIIGILTVALVKNVRSADVKEKEATAQALKVLRTIEHAIINVRELEATSCPTGMFINRNYGTNTYSYELKNSEGTAAANAADVATLFGKYIKYEGDVGNFCNNTPYCSATDIKGWRIAASNTYVGFKVYSNLANCIQYRMPYEATNASPPTRFNRNTGNFDTAQCWGELHIDTNGNEAPNEYGKDVYIFGLGEDGIAK